MKKTVTVEGQVSIMKSAPDYRVEPRNYQHEIRITGFPKDWPEHRVRQLAMLDKEMCSQGTQSGMPGFTKRSGPPSLQHAKCSESKAALSLKDPMPHGIMFC